MEITIFKKASKKIDDTEYEVIERKGEGHPDTISDTLAELISANYSTYTYKKHGYILRHMIDKLTVLGGRTKVYFGAGEFIKPIRILINGRFTDNFCGEKIPVMKIIRDTIYAHMNKLFPTINIKE